MTQKRYNEIPKRQKCVNKEEPYIGGAEDIVDDDLGKPQSEVNQETNERVSALENKVGPGGSVDERIAVETQRAQGAEGLLQSEINALNSQNYVTVDSFSSLPDTGAVDTVYRVSNWDGTQQDPSVYSEYAWNGSQYVHLSTKTQIGEVFDISAYHATGGELAKYADLTAALGTNGANIPEAIRKGGMSVKYVQTSDNKYVQYRLMSDTFNTTPANWQGVDDELTDDSNNLVKSGGVKKYVDTNIQTLPLLVSKYSIQVTTWTYNSVDDYKHLVIPVTAGDKITFNCTLQAIMYYALLASYITPVLGATPDFVTGYEGRQTILRTETLTIPAGTKYLIINNHHKIGLSELYVNGVSVFDGIWGVLHKFGGNITPEDLSFSLEQFEQVSNKTDEIIRSSDKDKFISQYGVNNNIEPTKAGLKGQKIYNLFEIKYRNFITNEGVVPDEDTSTNTSYNTSDYIPVTFGNKYYYVLGGSSSTSILVEFDSSKQLISNIVGTDFKQNGRYTPSSNNVAYVVLCSSVTIAPDYCFVDITNRLYAFKEEVPEVDIQISIVSNNIANPANVWDKTIIDSSGKILTKDTYSNYKAAYLKVNPDDVITIGGNDLGRQSYYSLFGTMPSESSTASGATPPTSTGTITQQEMIAGKSITIPNDCHYLFWQIQFNGSPVSANVKIQANRGSSLLPYDTYTEAITSINRIPLASDVPSDLEERVEQLESDVEDLQGQVLSSLIADLPVSADGSGIDVGYAYINSSTGVVTVKLS